MVASASWVMEVPDGVPESEVRHCAAHPSYLSPSLLLNFVALAEKEARIDAAGGCGGNA